MEFKKWIDQARVWLVRSKKDGENRAIYLRHAMSYAMRAREDCPDDVIRNRLDALIQYIEAMQKIEFKDTYFRHQALAILEPALVGATE